MEEAIGKAYTSTDEIYEARIYLGKKKVATIALTEQQVQRMKFEPWIDYDHKQNNSLLACGLTKDRMRDIEHLMFEFIKESRTTSRLCENLEKTLSTRELSFLSAQHLLSAFEKAQALAHLYRMLSRSQQPDIDLAKFHCEEDEDEGDN